MRVATRGGRRVISSNEPRVILRTLSLFALFPNARARERVLRFYQRLAFVEASFRVCWGETERAKIAKGRETTGDASQMVVSRRHRRRFQPRKCLGVD